MRNTQLAAIFWRKRISIPQWSDFNKCRSYRPDHYKQFQSHNGLILIMEHIYFILISKVISIPQWSDFNIKSSIYYIRQDIFQSHNGLILIDDIDDDYDDDYWFQSHNGLILIRRRQSRNNPLYRFQSHNGLILILLLHQYTFLYQHFNPTMVWF